MYIRVLFDMFLMSCVFVAFDVFDVCFRVVGVVCLCLFLMFGFCWFVVVLFCSTTCVFCLCVLLLFAICC